MNILLKSDLHLPKKLCIPLKMMKSAFYFLLKAFFVLKTFLSRLFGHIGKRDIGKRDIHILSNMSQSKGNQTVEFGQLTKYNKRNVFVQKLCEK